VGTSYLIFMEADQLKEEKKRIYETTRKDILARNLSNSEKYDNAILSLSTGILGLSLAFIKDVVPLGHSQYVTILIVSWCAFGAAIISALLSFALSQIALKRQLQYAEKYYLDEDDAYLEKKNGPAVWTEFVNYASGLFFIIGIVSTIWFVSLNIKGIKTMAQDNNQTTIRGATTPMLQKVVKQGATVPSLQPVKPSATTSPQNSPPVSQSVGDPGKTEK